MDGKGSDPPSRIKNNYNGIVVFSERCGTSPLTGSFCLFGSEGIGLSWNRTPPIARYAPIAPVTRFRLRGQQDISFYPVNA